MRDPRALREEAAVRVAVLKHNTGGTRATYAGTSAFWGGKFKAATLSNWEHQRHAPQQRNMCLLRQLTD
jgi:hypothetical protein